MFIPLLLIIITASPTLYSMEQFPKNHCNLPCFNPNNVNTLSTIIDVAEKSGDGLLMATLIHLCLPPDIIKTHINPHFSESITKKYKHKLITYKAYNKLFKETIINYKNNDEKWTTFSRHDGTYSVVPKIRNNYVLWSEKSTEKRYTCILNKQSCTYKLVSEDNKKKNSHFLLTKNDHNNKKFIFGTNSKPLKKIKSSHLASHYCFSNDCTFLVMGFKENNNQCQIQTYNTTTGKGFCFIRPGIIDNICSAHHAPICAVTNNNTSDLDIPHLVLFISSGRVIEFITHNTPITCAEFSPNDTRFLTCSYDEATNGSRLKLWNISDLNNIFYEYDMDSSLHILKAFFICDGKRIVTINKDGHLRLFDGLTGKEYEKYSHLWSDGKTLNNQETTPLCIWSNKHKLFINTFKNTIKIRKSTTGKIIEKEIQLKQTPVEIGLTADESTIVFINTNEQAYQLELYNQQDCNEINFIEKNANIVQLYTMFNICKNNKGSEKTTSFVETIKSYIQEQQKK